MRSVVRTLVRMFLAALLFVTGGGSAGAAGAQGLREHFEGKTIRIAHGQGVGGGWDLLARAFAIVLPQHLPGKPARIIVEPRPGGGPFRLNLLRALVRAKPDGLTVGMVRSDFIAAATIGEGPADIKLEDLKPLGTPIGGEREQIFCANPKITRSWEDIEKLGRPIVWGGEAPGSTPRLAIAPWLRDLGAPVKVVWGYAGSAELSAAFRRGETELASSCTSSLIRDYAEWIVQGNAAPIFIFGPLSPEGKEHLKRMGQKVPPHLYEVARKYITADWQKKALEAGAQLGRLNYSFFLSARVAPELRKVWVEAFRKILNDPEFLKILNPNVRDRLFPLYVEEYEGILESLRNLGPEGLRMLKKLMTG